MARTTTLVRAEAQHIRIVSLVVGDVYKRVIAATSYDKPKVVFGVVTDVLANGESSAIVAIEYDMTAYSDVEAKIVTLAGDDDMAVFPAQPEEVRTYFHEVAESQERKVATANRALVEAKRRLEAINKVLTGELTSPQTQAVEA